MVQISKFTVTRFTSDEMQPLWDSNEVSYPNDIRVETSFDGEFVDAEGNKDFVHKKVSWCASSFVAHKLIMLSLLVDVL